MVLVTVAVGATGALVWFMYAVNPIGSAYYPKCPSHLLFGIDCPGCGTARAVHALMHGEVGTAWGYNPAFFFGMAILALLVVKDFLRPSHPLSRALRSSWFVTALVVAIVAWTVGRNFM